MQAIAKCFGAGNFERLLTFDLQQEGLGWGNRGRMFEAEDLIEQVWGLSNRAPMRGIEGRAAGGRPAAMNGAA
jgi:hypothetical protein